ncbi:YdeI/OmpD-associated family protein [Pontibacillus sp. ALD_SL1]|uniref:YdeI/OmpD-associated family protein n=1 Tax=Pontibacillus sp. ALD_SL1 TaxID=2777185 RepID=UPI001A958386|nr:YdeI/OmpD-associated family protein [Pontibacillus sp. ALD_SL1]QST01232.1 YdeI/OmpD-associated family protein [Pontibacillus sp. ALD_SL1]
MSITEKLKLDKFNHFVVLNKPEDVQGIDVGASNLEEEHDGVLIFIHTKEELQERVREFIKNPRLLKEKGYLYVAYPKKGNKRFNTYVHRDELFNLLGVGEDRYIPDTNIKFSRLVSMDEDYTIVGLKKEKKKAKAKNSPSQCVADYEDRIEDVKALLSNQPEVLSQFEDLTPGYQRDWARQIYSAKQQQTRDKRVEKMIEVLSKGYKSLDLYRRDQK